MTPIPEPMEFADLDQAELDAVDAALTELACRAASGDDPAFAGLAAFAQYIDQRSVSITERRPHRDTAGPRPAAPARKSRPGGRRARHGRALLAIPALVLFVAVLATLPFNESPSSPLYPLHQLIFAPDRPGAAETVQRDLADAAMVLDRAAGASGTERARQLASARQLLASARQHLNQVGDPTVRADLERQISELQQRLDTIDDQGAGTDNGQGNANNQGNGQGSGDNQGNANSQGSGQGNGNDQGNGQGNGNNQGNSNGGHDSGTKPPSTSQGQPSLPAKRGMPPNWRSPASPRPGTM